MEGNGRRGVGAAGVTLSEIGAQWVDGPPAFREWLMLFASPLIRKRATLGGNLATASPMGDAAPLLLALDAGMRLIGPGGERLTPLDILHRLPQNHTGNAERLSFRFAFPSPIRSSRGFTKWPSASWMTSAPWRRAWAVSLGSAGLLAKARFAYAGVAEVPLPAAAEAVEEGRWPLRAVGTCRKRSRSVQPISDHRGSAEYRLAMTKSLF